MGYWNDRMKREADLQDIYHTMQVTVPAAAAAGGLIKGELNRRRERQQVEKLNQEREALYDQWMQVREDSPTQGEEIDHIRNQIAELDEVIRQVRGG